jgi:hypothetical protein
MKKIEIKYHYFEAVVFLLFFSYLYYIVEPALIYTVQDIVFFSTLDFFLSYLSFPGGLLHYFNAFFTELLYYSWLGPLVFTVFAMIIVYTTYGLLRVLNVKGSIYYLHLLPLIPLLILYSNYVSIYPVLYSLGFIIGLNAFLLFVTLKSKSVIKNSLIVWGLAGLVYYLAHDMVYFFIILCVLYQLMFETKSLLQAILYISAPLIIPYIGYRYLFLIPFEKAYFTLFNWEGLKSVLSLLVAVFIFIIISIRFLKSRWINKINKPLIAITVLSVLMVCTALYAFEEDKKRTNTYLFLGQERQWDEIIKLIDKTKSYDQIMIAQINRALYHKNLLLSRFFSIPQDLKFDGLILTRESSTALPLLKSDLYMEIGHLNQANHWAHEAMSIKGENGLILKRLAEVNLAKGEIPAAKMFLLKLKHTIRQKEWAEFYLKALEKEDGLSTNRYMQDLSKLILKEDFICRGSALHLDLSHMVEQGKGTRMAYEYLMIYYLLERNFNKFIYYLRYINNYGYKTMPKLFSEAIVAYVAATKNKTGIYEKLVDKNVLIRFNEFQQMLQDLSQNVYGIRAQLFQKFGDTYWYYLLKEGQLI